MKEEVENDVTFAVMLDVAVASTLPPGGELEA